MKNFIEEQRKIELIKEIEETQSEIEKLNGIMTQLDTFIEIEKAKGPIVLERERLELLAYLKRICICDDQRDLAPGGATCLACGKPIP